MEELTENQRNQLREFLLFDASKRREIIREVTASLSDVMAEQINSDEVYSGAEAIRLLSTLPEHMGEAVKKELKYQRELSAVLIGNIFQEAQANRFHLRIDIPQLEDDDMNDAAGLLCDELLSQPTLHTTESPQENVETEDDGIEQLEAENQKLREQLKRPVREWPEFIEAQQKLKSLNTEAHGLRQSLA